MSVGLVICQFWYPICPFGGSDRICGMQSPPQPNTIPHPSHRKKHFSGIAVYQESGMARVSSVHGNRGEQRERDSAWSVGPKLWTGLLDCWWDYRGSTRLIWPVTWTTIALRGIFSDESTCFTA